MNISEPFIRRPVATTLVMAALAFVGLVAYPYLAALDIAEIMRAGAKRAEVTVLQ